MGIRTNHFNFTERGLEALPIPASGQVAYYDSGTKDGLCVIVTYGGTKTYYSYLKFQGTALRTKIGRVGDIKLIDARAEAHTMREMATKGKDPSQKRREALHDISFKDFYEKVYKPEYSLVHKKPRSVANDDSIFTHRLVDFHHRKLLSIKSTEIEKLHNKTKQTHSSYTANRVLSLIKHMYVIAAKYGYMNGHENPAVGIRKFPEKSRDRFLQSDEFPKFFAALNNEQNDVFKAYVWISLFSGQRRSNVLTMRWSQVDFENNYMYFPDTKNDEPHRVPMVKQLRELLLKINQNTNSDWVLPSNKSKSGHLEDPKKPWRELLARAGIADFRLHDMRRTNGSMQAITGASLPIIGKSLGHKSTSATMVYARVSLDPVLEAMQKAADRMVELAKNQ